MTIKTNQKMDLSWDDVNTLVDNLCKQIAQIKKGR